MEEEHKNYNLSQSFENLGGGARACSLDATTIIASYADKKIKIFNINETGSVEFR